MGAVAAIVVALGIVALIWGGMQKFKAGRLTKAKFVKTGEAASSGAQLVGNGGTLSAEGNVEARQTLRSPVTGTECLYYELKVEGFWKDGENTKSKDYIDEKMSADFAINDGSGPVGIDASGGGDFEPFKKTFEETKKEGFLADLKSAVGKGEAIMFGNYAFENPTMSKANKFVCTEHVLPVESKLFACGRFENGRIIAPKGLTSLILSNKSRDELIGSAAKSAKMFMMGGAAAAAAGTVLGLVSQLV